VEKKLRAKALINKNWKGQRATGKSYLTAHIYLINFLIMVEAF
jgi:hypothetical protein